LTLAMKASGNEFSRPRRTPIRMSLVTIALSSPAARRPARGF
jgi:hypothetical protein